MSFKYLFSKAVIDRFRNFKKDHFNYKTGFEVLKVIGPLVIGHIVGSKSEKKSKIEILEKIEELRRELEVIQNRLPPAAEDHFNPKSKVIQKDEGQRSGSVPNFNNGDKGRIYLIVKKVFIDKFSS